MKPPPPERRRAAPLGRRDEDADRARAAAANTEVVAAAAVAHATGRQPLPRAALWMVGTLVGAALAVAILVPGCQRQAAIDRSDIADCREGNLPNGYLRLRRGQLPQTGRPRASMVLPILWCAKTVELDRPVRLPLDQERRYLDVLRRERLPVVDDDTGRVTGSEPLPAPLRR